MDYAPFEADALKQRKSVWDTIKADFAKIPGMAYDALAAPSRLVNAHMGEYSPGVSVQDMPKTMEQLDTAAGTATMLPGMMGATSVPGLTLNSGYKLPPLLDTYHGTASAREYTKMGKSPRDIGYHVSIDPGIADVHARRPSVVKDPSNEAEIAYPRVKPVVTDVRNAFRFPADPTVWKDVDRVMSSLGHVLSTDKYQIPTSLYKDVDWASKQSGSLEKNLIPMWRDKGFDATFYPHLGSSRYDSIMAFDPKQIMPKYSEEAQALIKERGILRAPTSSKYLDNVYTNQPWKMPQGILKKYGEVDDVATGKLRDARWDAKLNEAITHANDRFQVLAKKHGVDPADINKDWSTLFPINDLVVGKNKDQILIKTGPFSSKWMDHPSGQAQQHATSINSITNQLEAMAWAKKTGRIGNVDFDKVSPGTLNNLVNEYMTHLTGKK